MKRFVEGDNRNQSTLFPELLDDYISEENPIRVVDAFVQELDLDKLGFQGVHPHATGRPAYHPSVLLKMYIYGYLNRLQSSRRLEREAQRNVEMMWLTERLAPDFKTIADFRKDNGKAIRGVCREFVGLCRQLDLFTQAIVAIDGSKFKAVNNRDRNFNRGKMKHSQQRVEASINSYLAQLDKADRDAPEVTEAETAGLQTKLASLKEEMQRLKKLERQMLEAPDKQVSLTDPDSRAMKTRGTWVVGYNVQTAVEAGNHLIVTHEVTNTGSDRRQLAKMGKQASSEMEQEDLDVVADRGYYKNEEIAACDAAGLTAYVPKPQTSGNVAKGLFGKKDFLYIVEDDAYRCPAGERLPRRMTTQEDGQMIHRYWSSVCPSCALHAQCTPGKERRVRRWEHEAALEAMQARLKAKPEMMGIRKQTVEHPYGTIKAWMGATHFLTRGLERVSTEMSLHVLAYNLKRVMAIVGIKPLIEAMQA